MPSKLRVENSTLILAMLRSLVILKRKVLVEEWGQKPDKNEFKKVWGRDVGDNKRQFF